MASTVTIDTADGRSAAGARLNRKGSFSPGVYATNGVTVTAAQLEFSVLADLDIRPAAGYVAEWDKANGKVKLYVDKTPAAATPLGEVANATDLSAVTFRFHATGT